MTTALRDKNLLMEVFHSSGTKDNEEPYPKGSTLEGDRLIGLTFFLVVRFENDGVQEERQEAEDEE